VKAANAKDHGVPLGEASEVTSGCLAASSGTIPRWTPPPAVGSTGRARPFVASSRSKCCRHSVTAESPRAQLRDAGRRDAGATRPSDSWTLDTQLENRRRQPPAVLCCVFVNCLTDLALFGFHAFGALANEWQNALRLESVSQHCVCAFRSASCLTTTALAKVPAVENFSIYQ
jgi:hypothetical protein